MEYNGGCCVAMVGKDCVGIARCGCPLSFVPLFFGGGGTLCLVYAGPLGSALCFICTGCLSLVLHLHWLSVPEPSVQGGFVSFFGVRLQGVAIVMAILAVFLRGPVGFFM